MKCTEMLNWDEPPHHPEVWKVRRCGGEEVEALWFLPEPLPPPDTTLPCSARLPLVGSQSRVAGGTWGASLISSPPAGQGFVPGRQEPSWASLGFTGLSAQSPSLLCQCCPQLPAEHTCGHSRKTQASGRKLIWLPVPCSVPALLWASSGDPCRHLPQTAFQMPLPSATNSSGSSIKEREEARKRKSF